MRNQDFSSFELIDNRDCTYSGGVAILPSYLAKGLEFDAVVLTDAQNYPLDNLSARLLFVSITRAAHKLDICWTGIISPLLDTKIDHVIVEQFLSDYKPGLVTVSDYEFSQQIDMDDCIEQISRIGRLPLLVEGTIDPVVLDMIMRKTNTASKPVSEEVLIVPLKLEEERFIAALVEDWENQASHSINSALALTETVFGLLKNQIRNLALIPGKDNDLSLTDKITTLVRLKKLLEDANLSLATGRGAGRKRLLDDVDQQRHKYYQAILDTLIDYGLLDILITRDERISLARLLPEWAKTLLDYSLGFPSSGLDPDLIRQLPQLPKPIDLSLALEVANG